MSVRVIGGGELAARGVERMEVLRPVLAANENPLVANATLREDEWKHIDERVNAVFGARQTIVDDLRQRGLVQPLDIGTVLRVTERVADFGEATLSYDGEVEPVRDRVSYYQDVRAVPVIGASFQVNFRQLAASRQRGEPLDTTGAELAARKVNERLQKLFAVGESSGGPAGGGIPGLTTAPKRLTVDLTADWATSPSADPVGDVARMLDEAYSYSLFGPFVLYVPKNYWAAIQRDYKVGGLATTVSLIQRFREFADVEDVRPLDHLPNSNVVLVQLTRDVIDLSEAQPPITVQWQKSPFATEFRVYTIAGPHIKTIETDTGTSINGIVHLRAAP